MFRYKDKNPSETIASIKKILAEIGIIVSEKWFDSKVENIFSLRLCIDHTEYGANGKGITRELALASAYGELIERLGNGIIYKHHERYQTADVGFIYAPDEKILPNEYFKSNNSGKIFKSILEPFADNPDLGIDMWSKFMSDHISVPFNSEITGTQEYIPYQMLRTYGSNGMAAGNTKEEAFVQALSEIFERYCLRTIMLQKSTPPIISDSYIADKYPFIDKMLQSIRQDPDITVNVRYCGLQTNFPVIAVCLYDKRKHTDSISFGAHPLVEIAIERSITEAFQGRSISDISNLITDRKKEERYNILGVLKNGIGYFPREFHMPCDLKNHNIFETEKFSSNKDIKLYMLELCKENKYDVYSRYVKIGDMYTVQVIVPTISEIFNFDRFQFDCLEMSSITKKVLDGKFDNDQKILQTCLEFIDYWRKTPALDTNLSKNFFPINDSKRQEKSLLLLAAGFFKLGMYDRTLYYIKLLNKYLPVDEYICMQSITELKKENNVDCKEYLRLYFDKTLIEKCQLHLSFDDVLISLKSIDKKDEFYSSPCWLECLRKLKGMMKTI